MTNILEEILTMNEAIVLTIALVITALTGLIKIPIKTVALQSEEPEKFTKYITFLPLILGFLLSILYDLAFWRHKFIFDEWFVKLWLSSASMSLAIYAFIDKFIPSKKKILTKEETKANEELIKTIKELYQQGILNCEKKEEIIEERKENIEKPKKFVLGNNYDKTEQK